MFFTKKIIKIKTCFPEKTLTQISKLNICIYKVKLIDNELLVFHIKRKDIKKLSSFLERQQKTFYVLPEMTFKTGISILLITLLPVFAFVIFSVFCSNRLFQIKVFCEDESVNYKVSEIINEEYKFFSNLADVNFNSLKSKIYDADEHISYCDIFYQGNTLIANIRLKLDNYEYTHKESFQSIKSDCVGYIEEINVVQGTPVVKKGDLVKVGQTMVESYVLDSNGNKISIMPQGKVKIKAHETISKQVAISKNVYVRTGNWKCNWQICFMGKEIYSKNNIVDFKNFEQEQTITCISSGNILPVYLVKTKYYEVENKVVNFDEEKESEGVFLELEKDISCVSKKNAEIITIKKENEKLAGVIDFKLIIEYYLYMEF